MAPVAAEKKPEGHEEHIVDPLLVANVPGKQGVAEEAPANATNDPGGAR
jgi:hypothetical protein